MHTSPVHTGACSSTEGDAASTAAATAGHRACAQSSRIHTSAACDFTQQIPPQRLPGGTECPRWQPAPSAARGLPPPGHHCKRRPRRHTFCANGAKTDKTRCTHESNHAADQWPITGAPEQSKTPDTAIPEVQRASQGGGSTWETCRDQRAAFNHKQNARYSPRLCVRTYCWFLLS